MNNSNKTFSYKTAEYEKVVCNLCNSNDFKTLSRKDRYGLPVQTVICKRCGLIFISPRMTTNYYKKFYEGEYRDLLFCYKNKIIDLDRMFQTSKRFGERIARLLSEHIKPGPTIEVGSSVGGILSGLKTVKPSLDVVGIEPSSNEAAYAKKRGIKTYISLLEDFKENLPPADNVIITRSLNHLLSPRHFFTWAHRQLREGGKLIIAVLDFHSFHVRRHGLGNNMGSSKIYF